MCIGDSKFGPWQNEELQIALQTAETSKHRIIPVLLGGETSLASLPPFIQGRSFVDLRNGLTEQVVDQLVWGITGRKRKTGS